MTDAGQLNRRVTFRQRAVDDNAERGGAWANVFTRFARIQPLKGGEGVQAARMAGDQPVIITIRKDAETATVDNGWSAFDALATSTKWDVKSVIATEDRQWIEVLAVQHRGGDDG